MGKWLRRALLGGVIALAAAIGYLGFLRLSGNFHEVSPGTVYRGAQMDGQALVRRHRDQRIASMLNLRGENGGADWYETEKAVTDRLGIRHIDFRMSAGKQMTPEEARHLIEEMRDAPKPLLIHCMGGADRTGLAAALYVAGIDGGSESAADWQVSPLYGHVSLPGISRACAMDQTWERIEPKLGFHDS